MFEVLVFVFENYWRGDACPEPQQLGRRLSAHGFDQDEIRDALRWLDGLSLATGRIVRTPDPDGESVTVMPPDPILSAVVPSSANAMRVYSVAEQDHLGADCLGFLSFLESASVLPPGTREIVIDRAMAAPGDPVTLGELKIMLLMVYWSTGVEPDALVLDELSDDKRARVAH